MTKKVTTTVNLEPTQDQKLKRIHKLTKIPQSVILREGVDMVLAKYERKLGLKKKPAEEPQTADVS